MITALEGLAGIREGFLEEEMMLMWVLKIELDFTLYQREHPWLIPMPRKWREIESRWHIGGREKQDSGGAQT